MPNSSKVAAILVGGKGTRLRSIISDVPKPLAPIAGQPFLFIILRQLASLGISRIVLLTGYMHEKIQMICGDGHQFGLEILYSEEKEALGTAGALCQAQSYLKDTPDFILMNGDTYLDSSLENFLNYSFPVNALGLIGTMQPVAADRFGSLEVHADTMRIQAFREKNLQSTGFVNAGIYRLSKMIFDEIPPHQFSSLENDVFPHLIKKGFDLRAFPLEGEFVDIGVPESYNAFNLKMTEARGIKQCD